MSRMLIKLIGLGPATRSLMSRQIATNTVDNKASLEQLVLLEKELVTHLTKFFLVPHNFTLYTPDVIFIDNIRGLRTKGTSQYAFQIGLIKIYHYVRYSSIKLELLNLVKNPQESYIKIRWRVITKPGFIQFALLFWKFNSLERWKDGISTMHVNNKGKIYCHVCDNIDVETDDSDTKRKQTIRNSLVNRGLNV